MSLVLCLVCGGACVTSELPGLLRCNSCGFVTTDILLAREDLEKLYGANYFAGEEYMDYVSERELIEKNFRIRLKKLLQHISGAGKKRLFEIGCAYGFFLSIAREHFASVAGIDISAAAATYAAETLGLAVRAGDFIEYEFIEEPDVVCLWDTIEHLQKPDLYLEKAAAHLNTGGIIALTTGDIGSFVARLRGARWRQVHPPTHLHYFSKKSLTCLLEKHGFRLRYCGYDGMYRNVETMAYIILNIRHNCSQLYAALKRMGLLKWDLYLNLHDIMFVIAEKTSSS